MKLIIIRGPPGVGKSTISEEVAKELGYALLDFDVFLWRFNAFRNHEKEDYEMAFKNLLDVMKNYMGAKKGIVLEGVLIKRSEDDSFDFEEIRKLAEKNSYDVEAFFLKADKVTCRGRIKVRDWPIQKGHFDRLWDEMKPRDGEVIIENVEISRTVEEITTSV